MGAGRPHGSGKYGEPTTLFRIPNSLLKSIQRLIVLFYQKPSKLEEIVETLENASE